jgi:hypothetical protein
MGVLSRECGAVAELHSRLCSRRRHKAKGWEFCGASSDFQRRSGSMNLRHSAASLLLAQGVHSRAIMELLGHSSITVTMKRLLSCNACDDARSSRQDGVNLEKIVDQNRSAYRSHEAEALRSRKVTARVCYRSGDAHLIGRRTKLECPVDLGQAPCDFSAIRLRSGI